MPCKIRRTNYFKKAPQHQQNVDVLPAIHVANKTKSKIKKQSLFPHTPLQRKEKEKSC